MLGASLTSAAYLSAAFIHKSRAVHERISVACVVFHRVGVSAREPPAEAQDLLLMQPAAVGGCAQRARGEQAAALGRAAEEAYQCHLRAVAALQARPAASLLCAWCARLGMAAMTAERHDESLRVLLWQPCVLGHPRGLARRGVKPVGAGAGCARGLPGGGPA